MFKRLKRSAILWLISTKAWYYLMYKIFPYIRFSLYYTSLRGVNYHEGYRFLKPGMMIGSIDTKKLTGKAITEISGGILAHVALCVNKRGLGILPIPFDSNSFGQEIVEMTHTDYTFSDFFDLCKEAERVIIFDCDDWSEEYKVDYLIPSALTFHEARYDVFFDLGIEALYCSELILQADRRAAAYESVGDVATTPPKIDCSTGDLMGLGRPYISPDGLLTAKNVRVVWDSKGEFTGKTGPELEKIIFGQNEELS